MRRKTARQRLPPGAGLDALMPQFGVLFVLILTTAHALACQVSYSLSSVATALQLFDSSTFVAIVEVEAVNELRDRLPYQITQVAVLTTLKGPELHGFEVRRIVACGAPALHTGDTSVAFATVDGDELKHVLFSGPGKLTNEIIEALSETDASPDA